MRRRLVPDATGSHVPGYMDRVSSDIELVRDFDGTGGYSVGNQKIGLRFTAVAIPPGSVITSAYLTFRAVTADAPMSNAEATNLTIRGHLHRELTDLPEHKWRYQCTCTFGIFSVVGASCLDHR